MQYIFCKGYLVKSAGKPKLGIIIITPENPFKSFIKQRVVQLWSIQFFFLCWNKTLFLQFSWRSRGCLAFRGSLAKNTHSMFKRYNCAWRLTNYFLPSHTDFKAYTHWVCMLELFVSCMYLNSWALNATPWQVDVNFPYPVPLSLAVATTSSSKLVRGNADAIVSQKPASG